MVLVALIVEFLILFFQKNVTTNPPSKKRSNLPAKYSKARKVNRNDTRARDVFRMSLSSIYDRAFCENS